MPNTLETHTAPFGNGSPTPTTSPHTAMHLEAAAKIAAELTNEEKISLLHQAAPAIPRLGLASFRTGTEGLHGLSWLGTATTFPQPIGMAATWDLDLMKAAGEVVGTEVRAMHAKDNTVSLNVWAPVVNSLRHPLWGRNEEGFSEDPLLTGDCAIAYSKGLKGESPSPFWKTVPTLKHFLAYNNEIDRAVTSADLRPRVLNEYEFPAFSRPLNAGVIGAVMPSYNLVNDRPNHVAGELLDTLRTWSAHPISVVSDAAAPTNVVNLERYYPNDVESHAAMLTAGIDSFTDNDNNSAPTISHVTAAVEKGLISSVLVDRAVLRLLFLRSLTGEFVSNPVVAEVYGSFQNDPYAQIAATDIDLPHHRELAREMTAKQVVLLKNDGTLPLEAGVARVAVVGPMADRTLHDWYSGTPPYLSTLGEALTERLGSAEVTVDDGADHISIYSPAAKKYLQVSADGTMTASAAQLDEAEVFSRTDWGHGISTLRSHTNDFLVSGGWIASATATRVGGWVAQETFMFHTHEDNTVSIKHVASGKWLRVQTGSALVSGDSTELALAERFELDLVSSGIARVTAACSGADVAILAVGNDPHILGRETEDRPDLDLPRAARALWRAVSAGADRTVLTVISSYPYALREIAAQADAVVWSSHGGQELGRGLTDVLVGDCEPYGRLAQEWVADESCVPHILNYDIIGSASTYWYNECTPDFEFGAGLSYTTVEYEALTVSGTGSAPAQAQVTVRNSGLRSVNELVAIYCSLEVPLAPLHSPAPLRRLAGYARVELAAGESAVVDVALYPEAFSLWNSRTNRLEVHPGTYRVWAGTSRVSRVEDTWDVDAQDSPAVWELRGQDVRAEIFDAGSEIRLSDVTRNGGNCVAVAHGFESGFVEFAGVSLQQATSVTLRVARDRAGALGGVVVSAVWDDSYATAAHLQVVAALDPQDLPDELVGSSDRYEWVDVSVELREASELDAIDLDSCTLRVALRGNIRVEAIRFE